MKSDRLSDTKVTSMTTAHLSDTSIPGNTLREQQDPSLIHRTSCGHVVRAMTIAGSDSGGGAGIQADLKTFSAFAVYGTSVITALTAQNTLGVHGVRMVDAAFVRQQLDVVLNDIGTDAIKTGMLGSAEVIAAVATTLRDRKVKNVVVDPVMVAKGGAPLLQAEAVTTLCTELLPLASVITPNIPEAEALCGMEIRSWADCHQAAEFLATMTKGTVIIKGGHAQTSWTDSPAQGLTATSHAIDVVYDGNTFTYLASPRVDSQKTHGTGCTFSAAIASCLAMGVTHLLAIATAKAFIHEAIRTAADWDIGAGHGPTNHSTIPVAAPQFMHGGGTYLWQGTSWRDINTEV